MHPVQGFVITGITIAMAGDIAIGTSIGTTVNNLFKAGLIDRLFSYHLENSIIKLSFS